MLNPYVPEQKKRPQRDWVDVITCMDWEHTGGVVSIKNLVEDKLQRGIHRRKKVQREVAMAYLTHLGKDPAPSTTRTKSSSVATEVVNINPRSMYYGNGGGGAGMWMPMPEEHGFRGAVGREVVAAGGYSEPNYTPDFLQHATPVVSVAPIPAVPSPSPTSSGQIDYYD
jgi:hypothetical protein